LRKSRSFNYGFFILIFVDRKNYYHMKKIVKHLVVLCFVFTNATLLAQSGALWQKVEETQVTTNRVQTTSNPTESQYYLLDYKSLAALFETSRQEGFRVSFPEKDGSLTMYRMFESSVLHPDLQAKYPGIRSYTGYSIENPQQLIRLSKSYSGFNAIILNSKHGTQYIDCISKDKTYYSVYSLKDLPEESLDIRCDTDDFTESTNRAFDQGVFRNANDGLMRTYRLAVACTEEYASFHVNAAGLNNGTDEEKKAAVLSVINDKLTRVNAVYEASLSIRFELVPNNEEIIFLSSPFLDNDDYPTLLGQSQDVIDTAIGSENYDIGHMFATGGGGVVSGRTCIDSNKARGITGTGRPIGTQFEGILMHEIGHQFAAGHTWNGDERGCTADQRSSASAYEPGSGSTIMGYAGLCGSQNVQNRRDLYFHQISLAQMWNWATGPADGCPQTAPTGNNAPVADAGPDYTIPRRTPFKLTGSATDPDGKESLTYAWEQFDLGDPGIPATDAEFGPLVRSFSPETIPTRFIPRLEDYLDTFGQSTEWEILSSIDRTMNFVLTVRDNNPVGGQIGVDDMVVTVTRDAGQFRVTSQNAVGLTYEGGSTQEVTWIVAGTDQAPVGTTEVNILLSTDGGLTYDTVLVSNTANDGSEPVTLPDLNAENCRIMVEAVDNIFYNINFRDFAIEQSLSIEEASINNLAIYPNPNTGIFTVEFDPTEASGVTLAVYDLRGRRVFAQNYTNRGRFSETLDLTQVESGIYLLQVKDGQRQASKKILIN
jgi:hypothetical protein